MGGRGGGESLGIQVRIGRRGVRLVRMQYWDALMPDGVGVCAVVTSAFECVCVFATAFWGEWGGQAREGGGSIADDVRVTYFSFFVALCYADQSSHVEGEAEPRSRSPPCFVFKLRAARALTPLFAPRD